MTSAERGRTEAPASDVPRDRTGVPECAVPPGRSAAPGRAEPTDRPELRDHRAVLSAVMSGSTADDALAGLRLLGGLRAHLDELELALIESARDGGASWAAVAGALALTSRQAAEQRWLRLTGGSGRDPASVRTDRHRQRSIDARCGPPMARLRAAARSAERSLRADPGWTAGRPAAGLARATLAAAGDAPPGGLYDLVRDAVDDLSTVPEEALPPPVRAAATRLRQALRAAAPGKP